ncbi:uncharacterized protein LOC133509602 isoform X2 [Syngnathoides biaculeatus]|uniref:uncharacterized protein LOC133509602 isoform X2 n=1 Tax=Syngnathoides biaculeatus TaxID=300417 RepID=UPI002ADE28F4|nr:uncharacterized protein LOC133509602 isoform X2 [Syngnathoides biaculeatus]
MEPMLRGACMKDMKWYEMLTPLYEPLEEIDYQCNACPPPPPTPIDPADTLPVFTGSQYAGSADYFIRGDTLMNMNYRAPLHLGYMQPAHLSIGPGGDVTKQYLENYQPSPYEWPLNHPHAPTPLFHEKAMLILPEGAKLPPTEMPSLTDPISPSRKVPTSNKRKNESQEEEEKVYIKKPPNAFMIFRKEQRENVMAQLNIRDSAVANKVLGHMRCGGIWAPSSFENCCNSAILESSQEPPFEVMPQHLSRMKVKSSSRPLQCLHFGYFSAIQRWIWWHVLDH